MAIEDKLEYLRTISPDRVRRLDRFKKLSVHTVINAVKLNHNNLTPKQIDFFFDYATELLNSERDFDRSDLRTLFISLSKLNVSVITSTQITK